MNGSAKLRLYVDGVMVASQTGVDTTYMLFNDQVTRLGAGYGLSQDMDTPSECFQGACDWFRVFRNYAPYDTDTSFTPFDGVFRPGSRQSCW